MNGMLASLSAAALLAAPAVAQCLNVDKPGWLVGVGDDATFAPHYDLGFFFPMVGSLKGGYTHFRVSPNGWLMLTNGLDSPGLRSGFGSVDSIRGDAHSWPCIAPFWRDLDVAAPGGVYVDNSTHAGQSCTISWVDAVDYSHTTV